MSNASDHRLGRPAVGAFKLHALARKVREQKIGAPALLCCTVALCVLTVALLAWAGLAQGVVRGAFLLAAAGCMRLRLLAARLTAMTPIDGLSGAPFAGAVRRWGELWQIALILLAAGFCAYGAGLNLGPPAGGICAALVLANGWLGLRKSQPLEPARADPTTALAVVCLVSALEPVWGWRGQGLVIGLCLIAAVLARRLWRLYRMGDA